MQKTKINDKVNDRLNDALDELFKSVKAIIRDVSEEVRSEERRARRQRYADDYDDGESDDPFSDDMKIVARELDEAELAFEVSRNKYIRVFGTKIMLKNKDGSKSAKNGRSKSWLYQRPSGAKIWVPEQGSANRLDNSVRLVSEIAVRKLTNELNWIQAGKPDKWNWAC